jgi:hypothetical protein
VCKLKGVLLHCNGKFQLHPLIHTSLEFNLAQDMVTWQRFPWQMNRILQSIQGDNKMLKTILLTTTLIIICGTSFAADGSLQKDPFWRYSDTVAKDNIISRDKNGSVTGYLLNDSVLPGDQWILYKI